MSLSGGCQCGAVRYRVDGEVKGAGICHCRMCQKASGGFYGAYISAPADKVVWTRGQPKRFRSSNKVRRGFCPECGTQLTFEVMVGVIDLTIGSFDDPAPHRPSHQFSRDAHLPWVDELPGLPERRLGYDLTGLVSYQHPDHDTEVWPPKA
jgi:hypothetical protein